MARGDGHELLLTLFFTGPAVLTWGLASMRRKRLIESIPCSRVRSAAMGLVELQGRAIARRPQNAPFSGLPCCWWRCVVEELVDNGKSRRWVPRAMRGCLEPFFLEDATGRVLIDPDGAELFGDEATLLYQEEWAPLLNSWGIPTSALLFTTRQLRVREFLLVPHSDLYVLGERALRADHISGRKERFQRKIAAAKKDPERMAAADADGDGRIDIAEWDALRLKLEEEFLREEAARQEPEDERIVVRKPAAEVFIVSTRPEAQLLREMGRWTVGGVIGGIALTALAAWWAGALGYSFAVCVAMTGVGALVGAGVALWRKGGARSWA